MNINKNELDGAALADALSRGDLEAPSQECTGMVKTSDLDDHIAFSKSDCSGWIDIPTSLIARATVVGRRLCKDHDHAVCRIDFAKPTCPEAQALISLLTQRVEFPPFNGMPQQYLGTQPVSQGLPAVPVSRSFTHGTSIPPVNLGIVGGGYNAGPFEPTLPSCGVKMCQCSSPLPGYPPEYCAYYCCTFPSGLSNCPC